MAVPEKVVAPKAVRDDASVPFVKAPVCEVAATLSTHLVRLGEVATSLAAKQPLDATLTALAGLATAADKLPYFTGTDAAALATVTSFIRTLLDDTTSTAARATLELGALAILSTLDYTLVEFSGAPDRLLGSDAGGVPYLWRIGVEIAAAVHTHSAADIVSGTIALARLSGITDAQIAAANKDGASGTASLRTLGTGAAQSCAGNDARLSDSRAPSGAASGDLGGSYPSPTVTQARGLRETSGPTTLTVGAIADGEFLKRSGSTLVGATAAGGSGLEDFQVRRRVSLRI